MRRFFLLLIGSAVPLLTLGCGAHSMYPVQGTVFLDGQAATQLAGGTVTFTSQELHRSASGTIAADGTYHLGSLKSDDGAAPGNYQVTVSAPETAPRGERGKQQTTSATVAFEEPKNLEVTVEAKSNDIPIQLKSRPPARK